MSKLILSGPPLFFFNERSPGSNFHRRRFKVDGILFDHMEQYLMYHKAVYFRDVEMAKQILREPNPMACKRLGRQVRGFRAAEWDIAVWPIAIRGNLAKFTQNEDCKQWLLGTGDRELVEAAANDSLWGIGIGQGDPRIHNRSLWGNNKQGKLLMATRVTIKDEEALFEAIKLKNPTTAVENKEAEKHNG